MTTEPLPGVSVIIPIYNYARYLSQALDSLLGQTTPPAEIIVLDDGSTDNIADVVAAYGHQIRYHRQPNRGPGAARNAGVALARGQFLSFLDGDDHWEPDKLERQLAQLAADPSLDVVFCHVQQYLSPEVAADEAANHFYAPETPNSGHTVNSMLIRRAAYNRVGPFAEDFVLGEVIDWSARAAEARLNSMIVPEVLVWRRVHGQNQTLRHRQERPEYARVIKAALDRRRRARAAGEQTS